MHANIMHWMQFLWVKSKQKYLARITVNFVHLAHITIKFVYWGRLNCSHINHLKSIITNTSIISSSKIDTHQNKLCLDFIVTKWINNAMKRQHKHCVFFTGKPIYRIDSCGRFSICEPKKYREKTINII